MALQINGLFEFKSARIADCARKFSVFTFISAKAYLGAGTKRGISLDICARHVSFSRRPFSEVQLPKRSVYKLASTMNRLQSSFKSPIMGMLIKTPTAGFKTVTHCIFDMDGLLLGK